MFGGIAGNCGRSASPAGTDEDVMWEERGLRRATQTEHGESAVACEEADGEHAGDSRSRPLKRVGSVPYGSHTVSVRFDAGWLRERSVTECVTGADPASPPWPRQLP